MKSLKELDCYMIFEQNKVLNMINGFLVHGIGKEIVYDNGQPNIVKAFVYRNKEDSEKAAITWANSNRKSLWNYKEHKNNKKKNKEKTEKEYTIEYVDVYEGGMSKTTIKADSSDEAVEKFEAQSDGCAVVYVKEKK